jgi:hypothetical protein
MDVLLTKEWLKKHPLMKLSAARIGYLRLSSPDLEEMVNKVMRDKGIMPADGMEREKAIAKEEDLDELIRWMRRGVTGGGKILLINKLLAREQEATPTVRKTLLTTTIAFFAELSLEFFVLCKENNSEWLLEHYGEIRDTYTRSTMCLLLGFRGDASAVPFLMAQVELLEKQWPDKSYSQGPLLALHELQARFGKI